MRPWLGAWTGWVLAAARVAGWKAGQTVEVTVPWTAPAAVARLGVPNVAAGADVTDPAGAFPTVALTPKDGHVAVTLGADPVWVRAE